MTLRNLQIPSNLISELCVPQIVDITDELPKLRGGGWDKLNPPRKIEALTDIVWHHTAEFVSDNVKPETHANNHIKADEGGFPYHIYIKNGEIFQGNDLLTFTYGVRSNNYQTVHAVVEGCYSPNKGRPADELSDENKRAMIAVELTLRGVMPSYRQTNGHNYYVSTLCPGYSMTKFREDVTLVENKIKQQSTWPAKLKKIDELGNQYNYMFNLIKAGESDGNAQWGMNQLLAVRDVLKEKGLL